MRVLICGAAGRVGRILTRALGQAHDLILGDVCPIDDPRYIELDVRDMGQTQEAVADCDAVVHLSIARLEDFGNVATPEYADATFDVHVKGLYHVLSAAAMCGGKKVVYASSVSAVAGYPKHVMIGSQHRHEGGGVYGITKGFGEELCRMLHQSSGLPVIILRLGHVWIAEIGGKRGHIASHYLVHESDVASAFDCALQCDEPTYALVHIVGDNAGRRWDLEAAKALLGWRPRWRFSDDGEPEKIQ